MMKRLTEKEQDYYRLKDYQDPCKAIDQLGRYEDIGFSPEELQQLVDRQKWHVVADGDLPEGKRFYQCTVLDNQKNEVFVADVYNETTGFFYNNELYEVIAWRELPEPWEGVSEQCENG